MVTSYPSYTGIGRFSDSLNDFGLYSKYYFFNYNKIDKKDINIDHQYIAVSPINFLKRFYYFSSFFWQTKWSRILKKYQLIHVTSPDFFHLSKFNLNIIGTIHDVYALDISTRKQMGFLYGKSLKLDLEYANNLLGLTSVSKCTANLFNKWYPNVRIKVIHNWTKNIFMKRNKLLARSNLNLPLQKFIILNVSNDSPNKNTEFLMNILEIIKCDYLFIHIGKMHMRKSQLKNMINVNYVIDDETLSLYYNAADLYIAPSKQEGFNYPIIEAINSGLPVVASKIPIFREVLRNSPYLLGFNDLSEWVDIIESVSSNKNELKDMGNWFETEIGNYYRTTRAKEEFINYLQELDIL